MDKSSYSYRVTHTSRAGANSAIANSVVANSSSSSSSSISNGSNTVPNTVPNTIPNNPVVATPFSASKMAPPSSPSARNVRPTRASAINPRRLSSLLENVDDDD